MSANPSFESVLTVKLTLGTPWRIGQAGSGEFITGVPFTGGNLKSVEGGLLSGLVDAECIHGLDMSRLPASQDFTRLSVESIWRNKDDAMIHLSYNALLRMTDEIKNIFMAHKDAKSTSFGDVYAHFKFQTGTPKLKALEENLFVGSGRFVLEEGKDLAVEYNIGRIIG
ncbi:hypothetical protein L207DRAFT_572344 [Hyaloscypha variabilis F]|uniref:Uncharacterized protein n=1 Tax=Hyaloscypha variabilis (strain UAMH 11265 / GT02V1 / F) TaxID=1149755 RepID=A0A2J6R0I8_HYAVF|nr:hypothetical protein L207DRAFT_572344 [Hyaloscypha variabilis F]